MEGFAQSVKYIVKQGKKGLLQGIVGPVFQLIAAKGEHALAIETALGGAMQNIVAEDEEAAKAGHPAAFPGPGLGGHLPAPHLGEGKPGWTSAPSPARRGL